MKTEKQTKLLSTDFKEKRGGDVVHTAQTSECKHRGDFLSSTTTRLQLTAPITSVHNSSGMSPRYVRVCIKLVRRTNTFSLSHRCRSPPPDFTRRPNPAAAVRRDRAGVTLSSERRRRAARIYIFCNQRGPALLWNSTRATSWNVGGTFLTGNVQINQISEGLICRGSQSLQPRGRTSGCSSIEWSTPPRAKRAGTCSLSELSQRGTIQMSQMWTSQDV